MKPGKWKDWASKIKITTCRVETELLSTKDEFNYTFRLGNTLFYKGICFVVQDVFKDACEREIQISAKAEFRSGFGMMNVKAMLPECFVESVVDSHSIVICVMDMLVRQVHEQTNSVSIFVVDEPLPHPVDRSPVLPPPMIKPVISPFVIRAEHEAKNLLDMQEKAHKNYINRIKELWRDHFPEALKKTDDPELEDGDELSSDEVYALRLDIESALWPEHLSQNQKKRSWLSNQIDAKALKI